jgi:hypothetical protein
MSEFRVVPFRAEHLLRIEVQKEQSWALAEFTPELAQQLEETLAFTAMAGETVLNCAGLIKEWEGRYTAWAYISPQAKHYWKSIHRGVKEFLRTVDVRRIEANVDCDFLAAQRWAEKLGFVLEGRMRKFLPNGADAFSYVLVRQ